MHRHPTVGDFEHAWMHVANRIESIPLGRLACFQEVSAVEIGMQCETPHQSAIDEQVDTHVRATSTVAGIAVVSVSSAGLRIHKTPVIAAINTYPSTMSRFTAIPTCTP